MEFVKAMKIKERMCEDNISACIDCPFTPENNGIGDSCDDFITLYPEKAEKILIKWAKEHPQKTILQDFLEKYPNAKLDEDGTPKGPCPYHLGYDDDDDCIYEDTYTCCKKCWNRPLED